MRRDSQSIGLVAAAVCLAGCADNSMLDIAIELPTSHVAHYALVDVRPADQLDFSSGVWAESDAYPAVRVELSSAGPSRLEATVPAENVTREVLLRVRFCDGTPCEEDAPASCFVLEQPFHAGRVSSFRAELRAVPATAPDPVCSAPPVIIDRCAIGCIEPSQLPGPGADFCTDTGEHTCDR